MEIKGYKEVVLAIKDRAKRVRKEKGISANEVRLTTGINVARFESDKKGFSIETLLRLLDKYDVGLIEFLKPLFKE